MASFDLYTPTLKRWEGGFVNDPDDAGGATNMGVTLATYRKYYGSNKTVSDLKRITPDEWKTIMRRYWDRCNADRIENQSIAEIFVDWYVNAGYGALTKTQAALGLKADSIIGSKSLERLNAEPKAETFALIKAARLGYYNNLVKQKPVYKKFIKGWTNRVESFKFSE